MVVKEMPNEMVLIKRLRAVYSTFSRARVYTKTRNEMYKFITLDKLSAAHRSKFGTEVTQDQLLKLKNHDHVDIRKLGEHTYVGLSHDLLKKHCM